MRIKNKLLLHADGVAHEAIAAGSSGGSGVTQAWLRVDGRLLPICLDGAGAFDTNVPVKHATSNVHQLELLAAAEQQTQACSVDQEDVSERDLKLPPPSNWDDGGCVIYYSITAPSGLAVAFPALDERGFLIVDGRESIGATFHNWTFRNWLSGAVSIASGDHVGTESLADGMYDVELNCRGWGIPYGIYHLDEKGNWVVEDNDPYYDQAITHFTLVIPPRVNPSARSVDGAVHVRWATETVRGRRQWALYVSGHVFDGYGTAIHGFGAGNLRAVVSVNGDAREVSLDAAGGFLEKWVVGKKLASAYDVSLTASTRDDSTGPSPTYPVDQLHLTEIQIFAAPPKSRSP